MDFMTEKKGPPQDDEVQGVQTPKPLEPVTDLLQRTYLSEEEKVKEKDRRSEGEAPKP